MFPHFLPLNTICYKTLTHIHNVLWFSVCYVIITFD
nr:MAG TPA: hypothetical protein [Caudoviricetes sp.]DAP40351.1 MAG TPA: hypothetical protein [Caudoviricetes sp.]